MKKDIDLYDKEAFLKMHAAGKLAADVLDYITSYVKSGVSTGYLNDLCHDYILKNDAIPAPLNYRGFPKSTCISVNHVVCHGIPGDKILDEGDILKLRTPLDSGFEEVEKKAKIPELPGLDGMPLPPLPDGNLPLPPLPNASDALAAMKIQMDQD